jgi:hypothetical protein
VSLEEAMRKNMEKISKRRMEGTVQGDGSSR